LELLTKIGSEKSLRYAVQLMEPAKIISERKGKTKVTAEDIMEASKLFVEVKTSVEYVSKFEEKFLK